MSSILDKVDATKIQRFSDSGIRSIVSNPMTSSSSGNNNNLFSDNPAMQHLFEFLYLLFVIYSAYRAKTRWIMAFVVVTIFIMPKFIEYYLVPIMHLMKFSSSTINAYVVPFLELFGVGFISALGIFMILLKICVTKKLSCGYFQLAFASAFYAGFAFGACLIVFLCFRYIPGVDILFTNMLPNFLKPYSVSVRYVMGAFFGTLLGISLSRNAFLSGVDTKKFERKKSKDDEE